MTPRIQIVIPSSQQDTVLKQLDDLSGHLGLRKTMGKVKERFYWPGYEHDVELHVQEWGKCQRRNPPQPQPTAPLGTIKATHPLEKVSWDIMGPLPTTKSGNKYILVVTDLFTKWVEACHDKIGPPQNRTPRSIFFEKYGPPRTYISD